MTTSNFLNFCTTKNVINKIKNQDTDWREKKSLKRKKKAGKKEKHRQVTEETKGPVNI